MRGGFVACVGGDNTTASALDQVVEVIRWHGGRAEQYGDGCVRAVLLVDDAMGPFVEQAGGRSTLAHGCAPQPLSTLQGGHSRFAALEWDGGTVRAARDAIGEAPLYYRVIDDAVWFATEIGPLVALGGARPDLQALSAFAADVPLEERTGWRDIRRVPPGGQVTVLGRNRISVKRYWQPASFFARYRGRYESAVEDLRNRFDAAVTNCLDESTGVLMSGGLDSSAVAAVAGRDRRRVTLVTVGFPSLPRCDETPYSRASAAAAGRPVDVVDADLTPWDPAAEAAVYGSPYFGLPTGMYETGLARLAAQGARVALDGHDGDGVNGHSHAQLANSLLTVRMRSLARLAHRDGWLAVARRAAAELTPPTARGHRLRRVNPPHIWLQDRLRYFRGPVAARLRAEVRWRWPHAGWREAQLGAVMPPWVLLVEQMDVTGARFGIDLRHPFLDRRLVEFMLSLPFALKAAPDRTKPLLRDALGDLLAPEVLARTDKAEFAPVLDRRIDFGGGACWRWITESGVRLPHVDYESLERSEHEPTDRHMWIRLVQAHVFAAGASL